MSIPPSVRSVWARAADGWTRHAERIATMTRPATEALLEALAPGAGEHLLDVAAGTGDPSLELALRVAPDGRVVSVDGSADMLSGLLARAAGRPVRAAAAAAESLPFADATFGGLTCRFGAMFFDDPRAGLSEMRRVLRPGGRAVLVVWGRKDRNPYFTLCTRALAAAGVAVPDPPPGTRTVFEFADVESLLGHAREAGFSEPTSVTVPFALRLPGVSASGLLDAQREISGRIAELAADLSDDVLEAARAWLGEQAATFERDDGLHLPAECHVLRAAR
ncbi:MAG: methyltransferase domain-containing protein [Planctomycetes bacterium]|nr:methyltransferase domain-containing protein [Planctomycetota bacterium]